MSLVLSDRLVPIRRRSHSLFVNLRFSLLLVLFSLPVAFPAVSQAKDTCPWLNEATAAGFLNGSVTGAVTHSDNNREDANCDFTLRDKSATTVLRIEVETMTGAPASFASHAAQCGSHSTPLKAIGNEALACSLAGKRQVSEQVVGRVRDRAFLVRISTSATSADRATLRERATKVAEQVAGFLF